MSNMNNNYYENEDNEDIVFDSKQKDAKKKDNTNTALKIAVVLLAIIIIILLLLRGCGGEKVTIDDDNTPMYGLDLDPNAAYGDIEGMSEEEIIAMLNEQVKKSMINISMATEVIFANGTSEGELRIVNHDVNIHPQVVEINLKDTDELIYRSGLIPVGSNVKTGKLLVDLDAGKYDAIATFSSIDETSGALLGQAKAEIVINVLH